MLFKPLTLLLLIASFSGVPKPATFSHAAVVHLSVKPADDSKKLIPWAITRKLTWDDFQCNPVRNTDAVASTSTSLGIAYQIVEDQLQYQITCNFSKEQSWVLLRTPYILAHEQGHFDITEIFARRLYQALSNYQLNLQTYKQDINTIYQNIVNEKEAWQEAYDGETDHSRKKFKQEQWLEKINSALNETAPFAAYPQS